MKTKELLQKIRIYKLESVKYIRVFYKRDTYLEWNKFSDCTIQLRCPYEKLAMYGVGLMGGRDTRFSTMNLEIAGLSRGMQKKKIFTIEY